VNFVAFSHITLQKLELLNPVRGYFIEKKYKPKLTKFICLLCFLFPMIGNFHDGFIPDIFLWDLNMYLSVTESCCELLEESL
jgi:hypothetical protein